MTDPDTLVAVERWFRSRGIPHFIDHYSASRDVFTRVLAPLTAILMLELVTALDASWRWWLNRALARFESWSEVAALVGDMPASHLHPPADASPTTTPRLGRRQWGNVGLVVRFTQGLQIVFVSSS